MEIFMIKNCVINMKPGFKLFPSSGNSDCYPVYSFLIKYDNKFFLIDTGAICDDYEKLGTIKKFFKLDEMKMPLNEILKSLDCDKPQFIVNTHLHFDHSGQNRLFPGVQKYIQQDELSDYINDTKNPMYVRGQDEMDYVLVNGDEIIYHDEQFTLRVISTPGHSAGHQAVIAEYNDHKAIFLGDAGYIDGNGIIQTFGDKNSKLYSIALNSISRLQEAIMGGNVITSIFLSHDAPKTILNQECIENNIITRFY